jgi:hypothetical protein
MALILSTQTQLASQGSDGRIEWQNIGQLCGYLHLAEPTRKMIKTKAGKWEERLYETPVKRASVRLYRAADDKSPCCEKALFVAETKSGVNGEFDFKDHGEGRYWLVVEWRGGAAHVPLVGDKHQPKLCKSRSTHRIVIVDAKPFPRVEIHIS